MRTFNIKRVREGGCIIDSRIRCYVAHRVSSADLRAGHDHEAASAHPDAEGEFEVLSAPAVHAGVVAAHLEEVGPVHGEQSSRDGGASHGRRLIGTPPAGWRMDPGEVAVPLETPQRQEPHVLPLQLAAPAQRVRETL